MSTEWSGRKEEQSYCESNKSHDPWSESSFLPLLQGMHYNCIPSEQKSPSCLGEKDSWGDVHRKEAWGWSFLHFWLFDLFTCPFWEEDKDWAQCRDMHIFGVWWDFESLPHLSSYLEEFCCEVGSDIWGGSCLQEVHRVGAGGVAGSTPQETSQVPSVQITCSQVSRMIGPHVTGTGSLASVV